MAGDYDVVIVGSGFGGSVSALRAAEKGYRVGVMESGRRLNNRRNPKSQWHFTSVVLLLVPSHSTASNAWSTSTTY